MCNASIHKRIRSTAVCWAKRRFDLDTMHTNAILWRLMCSRYRCTVATNVVCVCVYGCARVSVNVFFVCSQSVTANRMHTAQIGDDCAQDARAQFVSMWRNMRLHEFAHTTKYQSKGKQTVALHFPRNCMANVRETHTNAEAVVLCQSTTNRIKIWPSAFVRKMIEWESSARTTSSSRLHLLGTSSIKLMVEVRGQREDASHQVPWSEVH